jgi:major membrane immunogen (membrane-anchored lipoprotein)
VNVTGLTILCTTNNKEKTSRQTHTQETTKLTKKNSRRKNKWKRAECDHVKKGKISRDVNSFRHMKIKIPYKPEDGHVNRNM